MTCDLAGSEWLNVDDRMGFVFAGTGSAFYLNKHYHEVFHAVYDELILGHHVPGRQFKKGEKVAELAVLWCPEQEHQVTSDQGFDILDAPKGVFAARVDDWLCACNFTGVVHELSGITLEPLEPRLVRIS